MNPPRNMSPSQLWAELTESPRPHRIVDFPRKRPDGRPVGQVAIWVLLQEERIRVAAAAERRVRELIDGKDARLGGLARDDVYENVAACELLFRACREVTDLTKPAFPSAEAIAEALTGDEVAVLLRAYTLVQTELGPIVATMTEDEVESWIDRLTEAGNSLPLGLLSDQARNDLTMFLARRWRSFPTDTRSHGSRSDDGARDKAVTHE